MGQPRVVFLVLLSAFAAKSVLSSQFRTQALRQFNAGQDAYYASSNVANHAPTGYGKGCDKLSAKAVPDATTRCSQSGCRVKCKRGYRMDRSQSLFLSCDSATGAWTYNDLDWKLSLPSCLPYCRNGCPGGLCVAPNKCESETAACDPPCQNGGECILDLFCNCPEGYSGDRCEKHTCNIADLSFSHSSIGNAHELTQMTVECDKGYKMKSGLSAVTFLCNHGTWINQQEKSQIPNDVDLNCYA